MYRKMGIRYLLLFMASDTSGKIILIKEKNVTCNLSEKIMFSLPSQNNEWGSLVLISPRGLAISFFNI